MSTFDKRSTHCLPCAVDLANERAREVRDALQACRAENSTLRAAIRIVSQEAVRKALKEDGHG